MLKCKESFIKLFDCYRNNYILIVLTYSVCINSDETFAALVDKAPESCCCYCTLLCKIGPIHLIFVFDVKD